VGDGARMKLCNNLLAGINLAGAAEVFALASHLGLDLPTLLQVVSQSSGQSWIASDRLPRALAGDFAPRAHMSLLAKDTQLALDMARSAGALPGSAIDSATAQAAGTNPLPLGQAATQAFAQALVAGFAHCDDAALLPLALSQTKPKPQSS
jgi:L-threonate 2-dehydrogenase